MLLSMTGFGEARVQTDRLSVAVELKAVNNRYLKVLTKCPDKYASLEPEIERVIRNSISRGTVSVVLRVDTVGGAPRNLLKEDVLKSYWQQLSAVADNLKMPRPEMGALLALPGVVAEEDEFSTEGEADWPQIEDALRKALDRFQEFRIAEGRQMEQELRANCQVIEERLQEVAAFAPSVAREYRDKLHQRLKEMLVGTDATIGESDLIREVSIFADRCDINEEITRLRSHLEQFEVFVLQQEPTGRKLEFLGQEMFREVNTIGSKANNVAIAHSVVEMKASIEKMREILQNVE